MSVPVVASLLDYLRLHPIPRLSQATRVQLTATTPDEQRFRLTSGATTIALTCYSPPLAERARRELAGLRLGGTLGLSPTLALGEDRDGPLGGAVIAQHEPHGAALGARPLSDDEVTGWLFLLLTLHHLAPDGLEVMSTLSPDLATWWRRQQPAWLACRAAYTHASMLPLIDALARLHVIVSARIEARGDLWRRVPRRPCHGNAVPAHLVRDDGRLILVDWSDFGLGDPAIEVGRVAVLAVLAGELSSAQYTRFLEGYVDGVRDLADPTLADRLAVFTSVVPLGFIFVMLQLLAQPDIAPAEQQRGVQQIERALAWTQSTLGITAGDPRALVAPLRRHK